MKVTKQLLKEQGACSGNLKMFIKVFPVGATISLRSIALAEKSNLNLEWFAENFFTVSALAEYEKVNKTAWDEYKKVKKTAWDEYKKVNKTAWDEYNKIRDTAWDEYKKIRDTDAFIAGCTVMGWLKSPKGK